MYTIGQFSQIGFISTKTLRYYDEIGLLKPARTNEENQYRYYSEEQLTQLSFILELRKYGISLEDIKTILTNQTEDNFIDILQKRLHHLNDELKNIQHSIVKISNRLEKLKLGGSIMDNINIEIIIKEKEPMTILSNRKIIKADQFISLVNETVEVLNKHQLQQTGPTIALHYGCEYNPQAADTEIGIPIASIPSSLKDVIRTVPGGTHVAATYQGPYENIIQVYTKIHKWINANNYQVAGPPYEAYVKNPCHTNNPEEYITELSFPVTKCC